MKTLLIMRHGKSDWTKDQTDFDRPLTKRGWDDAPLVGRMLAGASLIPDLILTSPAVRAWTTAKLVAGAGEFPDEPVKVPALYGADADQALALLREQAERHELILVVGHNPTLEELAGTLCGTARIRLPTAALACLDCDGSWRDLSAGTAILRWLIIPKLLRHIAGLKH